MLVTDVLEVWPCGWLVEVHGCNDEGETWVSYDPCNAPTRPTDTLGSYACENGHAHTAIEISWTDGSWMEEG